jgi:hypothetical protein
MNAALTPDLRDHDLESAQREIAFCEQCQPIEAGQRVWRYGIPLKISDLLDRLGVPADDHEFVAESLECNNCGALLNLSATVGVKTQSEREWDKLWRKWETQYANRFRDLHDFLVEYPTLGLQHRLGRQLFKALGELPRYEIGMATFYCAKPVRSGAPLRSEAFNPMALASHTSFYHHAGQQTHLLTDSEAGAAREILFGEEEIAWLQKFQLARCKGILDLSRTLAEGSSPLAGPLIYGLCYRGAAPPSADAVKAEIAGLVSRFLADCARLHCFNGIRTKSQKHYANNLVLFSWPADVLAPVGEPYWFDLRAAAVSAI